MNKLKDVLQKKQVDPWQIFSDLIGLSAVYTGILYIGGYLYLKTYYENFFIDMNQVETSITYCITAFIVHVITKTPTSIIISFSSIISFAILFYIFRNILKTWLGYVSICVSFATIFFVSAIVAKNCGVRDAKRDWNDTVSALPKVKIVFHPQNNNLYDPDFLRKCARSELRMVYENEKHAFLFMPQVSSTMSSDLPISVVLKNQIILFERIIPGG